MKPVIYLFGGAIAPYYALIALSLVLSFIWIVLALRKERITVKDSLFFCALLFTSGFLFSMFFHIVLYYQTKTDYSFPGLTFHGAFIGCLIAMLYFAHQMRLSFFKLADAIIPVGALSVGLIRIGCFLAGCCRGIETHSIMGVPFPDEMNPVINRHPVQLYDSYLNLMLFFYLFDIHDRKKYDGHLFLLFLFWNSVIRFFMEYYRRGVSAQVMFGVITQAQLASLAIIAVSVYFMKKLSGRSFQENLVPSVGGET